MHGQARVNTYFPPVPPTTTGGQGTAAEHGSSSCRLGRAEERMVASAGTSGGGAGGSERSGGGWAGQVVGTSAGGEVTRSYLVPFEFKSGREYMGHRGQVRQCRSGA